MNFGEIASKYYRKIEPGNQEKVLEEIFSGTYKLIEGYNERSQGILAEVKAVGEISADLNKRNKGEDKSRKDFEVVMAKFNDINNLFRELGQGTAFYTKLSEVMVRIGDTIEGYVGARRMEAQELEASMGQGQGGYGGGNFGGGQPLPNMYPNQPQQNLGFYVPPPMVFQPMPGNFSVIQNNQGSNNMSDMLSDLMRSKPSFSADVFGGKVYQSKFM
mgnify:FL=1